MDTAPQWGSVGQKLMAGDGNIRSAGR